MKKSFIKASAILLFGVSMLTFSSCVEEEEEPQLCSELCQFSNDDECDDGGTGSLTSFCDLGTDCIDCGRR